MQRIPTVGVVIIHEGKVLLVRHGEGAGHLTGSYGAPGGRIDQGESATQAAVREVKEETFLDVNTEDLVEIPHIYEADLERKNGEILNVSHTVFATAKFEGELKSTDETKPEWIEIDKINTFNLLVNTEDMVKRAGEVLIHNTVTVSLIAAIGKNRELGRGNELIFKIPEDMKFFRDTTRGHAVIMGRKTFESIGRPLPDRYNIVITRDTNYIIHDTSVKVVHSLEEALEFGKTVEQDEIFVIGGAQIYSLALPFADKLYLTLVDSEGKEADAFFPDYSEFKTVVSKRASSDENYSYTLIELTK